MSKAKAIIFHNNKLIATMIAGFCIFFVLIYILAVNFTVRNVAKRQVMEKELSNLSTRISELEFQYINKKNSITLEYAKNIGFVPTSATKFVSRQSAVAMVNSSIQTR